MIGEVQSQDLVISKQLGMDITRYKNIYSHVAAAIQGRVSISLQGSDPDKEDKVTFVIVSVPRTLLLQDLTSLLVFSRIFQILDLRVMII
jgi:DNA polymerase elongation subunit (family B)